MEAGGPTAEEAAALVEALEERLRSLPDPTLRRVALLRMEGRTLGEIAAELGCVTRTVERKIDRIRDRWGRGGGDAS
jgi:DNA-directed RNA polymerase specialized sigma24 family protein